MTTAETDNDPGLLARAAAIHARVLTMDTHVDIPPDFGTDSYDPREAKGGHGQIDLVGMERGGLDAVFFIVYVGQGERNAAGYARAMADAFAKFAAIRRMTDVQYPETIAWRARPRTSGASTARGGARRSSASRTAMPSAGTWTSSRRTTTLARATWG